MMILEISKEEYLEAIQDEIKKLQALPDYARLKLDPNTVDPNDKNECIYAQLGSGSAYSPFTNSLVFYIVPKFQVLTSSYLNWNLLLLNKGEPEKRTFTPLEAFLNLRQEAADIAQAIISQTNITIEIPEIIWEDLNAKSNFADYFSRDIGNPFPEATEITLL